MNTPQEDKASMPFGTVTYNRNLFHRLGDALTAFTKGLPSPSQLYPPQQGVSGGFLNFPGWPIVEAQANGKDEARVRKAVQSTSVFANMRAIATEFAAAELVVKERTGKKLEDVENHPLELLWEAPNEDMGRSFLMAFWAWSYTMTGKAYLYWLPAGGEIAEIWPIPPFMIQPVPASKEFIGGYAFRSRPDADLIVIPREYITYSHSPNLFDIRDGLSFIVAAMTPIESEISMGFWNRNFFNEQNGVPDGLITVNKDTLDSDLVRIRSEIRDFFGGTRRGVAVARSGDMDYKPFGRTQKDAEFIEGQKLVSTQIGRTMGFPDGYWSESANRANAEQARATMIAGAVWPLLVALHEDMNAGAVRRWYGEQYRAEFKDIRPEDRALKLQELGFYAQIETIDQLRERIGDDPLGDPRGLMLIAEVGKGTPIPATPAAEETEAYVAEQEAALAEEEAPLEEEPLPEGGALSLEEEGALPMEEAPPVNQKAIDLLRQWRADDAKSYPRVFATIEGGKIVGVESPDDPSVADLSRWERKALKSLKRFNRAAVPFESASIPLPEQERIAAALKIAQTVEEVKAAFKAAPKRVTVDALAKDDEVLKRARKLREEVKKDE